VETTTTNECLNCGARDVVIGPIYMAVILVTAVAIGLGWLALRTPGALPH
jgi:hypothetical protein